jgi:hypothetical protein
VKEVQISGFVPEDVRDELERITRARGLKKGKVLEQALRHHLRALQEIPEEFIIPPTLVLTRKSFEDLLKQLRKPPKPTPALRQLMKGRPVSEDGLH